MAEERFDEKEVQKREEKWEEKHHDDLVSRLVGATFLIWAGVVLLANNMGFLSTFTDFLARLSIKPYDLPFDIPFVSMSAWQVFFLGGGTILLFEIAVRLLVPVYRRHVLGTVIGAIALFSFGLGNWNIIGPLILVALGVSFLLRGLSRRH